MASLTVLRVAFPFKGPWGKKAEEPMRGQAEEIAKTPGLRWKLWLEDEAGGRSVGIYLFADEASARRYRDTLPRRLGALGVADFEAEFLAVNEALSRIDRGPID